MTNGWAVVLALASVLASGCDNSQAWHAPDWSLGRMQDQPRLDPFDPGMRAPPPFTVARGSLARPQPAITRALVERGRTDFDTFCAPCHGVRGDGDSVVAAKMLLRRPPSVLEPRIRALSDERLAEIVTRGYGLMPPYGNELAGDDRWATVAYVRALEVAQGIDVAVLPASIAAALPPEAP